MARGKLCIDIGGTKIIFAILSGPGRIEKSTKISTPNSKKPFLRLLSENIIRYLPESNGIINVSIAGRLNEAGKVVFCPNLPIKGFGLKKFMQKFSEKITIENDGNCFAIGQLYDGYLEKAKSGLVIVWGTGIGGSVISKRRVYKGGGFAAEVGHVTYDYKKGTDVESVIGGKSIQRIYCTSGVELDSLAESGNKKAINIFSDIGRTFGYYLSSLIFVLDPDIIVIGGSFANSWKFMRKSVYNVIKEKSLRGKANIRIARGKFYVVRGCYFLDEYEDIDNKF